MNIDKYLEGITYTAEFIPLSHSRNKDSKHKSLNWVVTLSNGNTTLSTDYSQGVAHIPGYDKLKGSKTTIWNYSLIGQACETGKSIVDHECLQGKKIDKPKLEDILYSLVLDSAAIDQDFEDWAADFGYDSDSRSAEKMYNDCVKIGRKMRKLFGGNLEALRKEFANY